MDFVLPVKHEEQLSELQEFSIDTLGFGLETDHAVSTTTAHAS